MIPVTNVPLLDMCVQRVGCLFTLGTSGRGHKLYQLAQSSQKFHRAKTKYLRSLFKQGNRGTDVVAQLAHRKEKSEFGVKAFRVGMWSRCGAGADTVAW